MKMILGGLLAFLGLLIIAVGAGLGWGFFPGFVDDEIKHNMDLTDKDSEGFHNFKTPPVPWYMKFYLFNIDNPEEVAQGAMPRFTERGPYSYKETKEKRDISWNENNTMNFAQYRKFTFDPDTSCSGCTKDDNVTLLNLVFFGVIGTGRTAGAISELLLCSQLAKDQADYINNVDNLFLTASVDTLLFSGFRDDFLSYLVNENDITKVRLPPQIQENGFAVMNPKDNSTYNECYQVSTETETQSIIELWGETLDDLNESLHRKKTCSTTGANCKTWWPSADYNGFTNASSTCNMIKGTNKEQFPPFMNQEDPLWTFVTDLCRSLYLEFREEIDIDGIPAWRYSVPKDGGWINKTENVCFCSQLSELVKKNDTCIKAGPTEDELDITECGITECFDGMMDLSNCMFTPLYFSSPHFYLSEFMLDSIGKDSGLNPVAEKHETVLDVEPLTGMSLRGHSRIQINVPVISTTNTAKYLPLMDNMTDFPAFPVLWLDEGAEIDQENIDKLKSMIFTPLKAIDGIKYTAVALGPLLIIVGVFLMWRAKK